MVTQELGRYHQNFIISWLRPSSSMNGLVSTSIRLSVWPSVSPSVCQTVFTMFPSSYHHQMFGSYYNWEKWCPSKMSRSEVKVKVTVNTQFSRFRTVTPVLIHIWQWNDAQSLMWHRRGALFFFFFFFFQDLSSNSRSHGTKRIRQFWHELDFSGL